MKIQEFVDYINQNAKTKEVLTVSELKQSVAGSYRPIVFSKAWADEIISDWNKNDPAIYGDPHDLLGCTVKKAESDWLAQQSPRFQSYGTMY